VGTIWDPVAGCSEQDTRPAGCLKCEGICLQVDLLLRSWLVTENFMSCSYITQTLFQET
jgi:hypothetical protein